MEISDYFYLINTHQRIYWLYLLSALLLALMVKNRYALTIFNKAIYTHPSAKLDYLFFMITLVIKALIIAPLLFSAHEVALTTLKTVRHFFEYQERLNLDKTLLMLFYTFTLFIVSDFTRFLLHRLMHNNKFLWRFHAIHHSATVLTPITYYRVHPLESFLFGLRYALSVGVVSGIFIYFYGSRIELMTLLGVNVFLFIYALFGANLRHSHIPLRFGNMAEKVFVSPYMHQIHHTKEGFNSNFGGVLSIWDALFKTRKIAPTQALDFGLHHPKHSQSLRGLFLEPFYKSH